MLSRRDKLLIAPWEQRRYENHLRKIHTAVHAIDNAPPLSREHVAVKLKKRQREIERMRQIENDNLLLLRRINYVMNTNRVDNVNVRALQSTSATRRPITSHPTPTRAHLDNNNRIRHAKCLACTPDMIAPRSESTERVPWEAPKMFSTSDGRQRSKSLPNIMPKETRPLHFKAKPLKIEPVVKNKQDFRLCDRRRTRSQDGDEQTHRLLISRGSLMLNVRFPSDSQILLQDGSEERVLFDHRTNTASTAKI